MPVQLRRSVRRAVRVTLSLAAIAVAGVSSAAPQAATPVVWRTIAAGAWHSCGLTADGVAYCWGENDWGQLGDGTRRAKHVPVAVAVRPGIRFRSLSLGATHTCALAEDGAAWCWGDNRNGAVGDRTRVTRTRPVAVVTRLRFRSLSASDGVTCAAAESGAAYCWGGSGSVPVAVAGAHRFEAVAVGARICGLTADSAAVCWRELDGDREPAALVGAPRFVRLDPGDLADCGVTADGAAHCWGGSVPGRATNPSPEEHPLQSSVVAAGLRLRTIGVRWRTACGLALDGTPRCWGEGGFLVPGVSEREVAAAPVAIAVERPLVALALGQRHACGLTGEGTAYCWGLNSSGQLGDGTDTTRRMPTRVAEPAAAGASDVPGSREIARRTRTWPSQLVLPPGYDASRRYPVVVLLPPTFGTSFGVLARYAPAPGRRLWGDTDRDQQLAALAAHLRANALAPVSEFAVLLTGDTGSTDDYITGEAWWETVLRYDRGILADLDSLATRYSLDTGRVVLAGFSLGGDLSWALAQRNPARFAGAIVMGSRAGYRAPEANVRALAARGARFYFAMGEREDSVRIAGAEAAMALLRRLGVAYRHGRIPGMGHEYAPMATFTEALGFVLGPR